MATQFVDSIMEQVMARNPGEREFHQAVREVAESVAVVIEKNPEFAKAKVLELSARTGDGMEAWYAFLEKHTIR